jgi:hypothetical protein
MSSPAKRSPPSSAAATSPTSCSRSLSTSLIDWAAFRPPTPSDHGDEPIHSRAVTYRIAAPNERDATVATRPERHLRVDRLAWARARECYGVSLSRRRRTVSGVEFGRAGCLKGSSIKPEPGAWQVNPQRAAAPNVRTERRPPAWKAAPSRHDARLAEAASSAATAAVGGQSPNRLPSTPPDAPPV